MFPPCTTKALTPIYHRCAGSPIALNGPPFSSFWGLHHHNTINGNSVPPPQWANQLWEHFGLYPLPRLRIEASSDRTMQKKRCMPSRPLTYNRILLLTAGWRTPALPILNDFKKTQEAPKHAFLSWQDEKFSFNHFSTVKITGSMKYCVHLIRTHKSEQCVSLHLCGNISMTTWDIIVGSKA